MSDEQQSYVDSATGRRYTVDPTTGLSRWADEPPASNISAPDAVPAVRNGLGVAALLLGVASFLLGPLTGIPAMVLGFKGRRAAQRGEATNKGMATTGLVLGGVMTTLVALLVPNMMSSSSNDAVTVQNAGTRATPGASADDTEATPSPSRPVVGTTSSRTSPPPVKPTEAPVPARKSGGLGVEVRDGKFAFTVKKIKCGVGEVGSNPYLKREPQGGFCLVTLAVTNIGDEPQTLFSSAQYAFIGGRKYSVDDEATIYAADGNDNPWIKEINPGNGLTGTLVFDIPKGKKIERLEFHDSLFSGGVTIDM